MQDRDLILGVLATQAGFATPAQVMEAASSRLINREGPSLLSRLESSGVLSAERRKLLEAMATEALAASGGEASRVLETLGGGAVVARTFGPPVEGEQSFTSEQGRIVPPEREGQYTRLDELGRGGQSVVWRALDEFVGRVVALKELTATTTATPQTPSTAAARARFLREARLTARLDHPGIVAVLELARRPDGTLFCTQKLIRGETLKARLARCESLRERLELLPHLTDACHAIAYAHSQGVFHRDLKPSNVMVGEFGETVVVDWGLAKERGEMDPPDRGPVPGDVSQADPVLTVAGIALGTPSYMSPEQARGALAEIDERSDVFSLGAILFEVLTGRLPFEGANPEQVIAKAAEGRLPPVRAVCPEVPPELAAIADRAVQRAPKDRYPGADALARELLAYRAGGRVAAYEYGSWELVKKFVGRHRALSAVSAAALVVLVTSAVVIVSQLHVARLNLATSFLERARAAEQASDWGRAAGYYAASRLERDTREARWGYALARQRLPHRVVARNGTNQSAIDVGFTPDGQAVVLAHEPPWLIGRELESGREQWRLQSPAPITDTRLLFGGLLRLWSPDRMLYFEGPTGRLVEAFDRANGIPCPWGPPTRRVLLANGLVTATGPGTATVSWKAGARPVCAVSSDGGQLALQDLDGVVHLWSLTEGKELASRHAPDASDLLFTAHGLAAVRGQIVQVFGGADGDFSIVIPGRAGVRGLGASEWATNVVSPDGHLLVIARRSSSQADLLDLRMRTVVSAVSYAAGTPRFAFSPSGERLLVGGLLSQSSVAGWDIRSSNTSRPIEGAPIMGFYASQDGSRFVVFLVDPTRPRYELRTDGGTLLRAGPVGPALAVALSPDGHRIAVSDDHGAAVLDADSGETLWRVDCDTCRRLVLSGDGSLLLTSNGKRMDLWKAGGGKPIWSESERVGRIDGPLHLTRDGRRLLWGKDRSIYVHSVGQANDAELALDGPVVSGKFSYDGRRLAVATVTMLGAWEVEGLKALWRVRNPSWVFPEVYWSGDDSTLLLQYVAQGTTLRDSATGDAFATLGLSRPAAFEAQERVLPSLRYRISSGDGSWELSPLPQPDPSPPRESLSRVLSEAGLELHGAELVDAAPR